MPARLRLVPLILFVALGCGLHLHRPRDAASAEGADGELKAARLVDGFTEELAQSQAMQVEEVAAAQAWADVGRDRDLLDILGARDDADPELQPLFFLRCRARFKGDGWTTLCSKISARLFSLTGHAFPLADPAPAPTGTRTKLPPPSPGPDPGADLLRELRDLQRHWKGPSSRESQLARAVNEYELAARAQRLSPGAAPPPRCPLLDLPGRSPVLQASIDRQRGLCRDRRDNLDALAVRAVCRGPTCGPSELAAQVARVTAVHDALGQHHEELGRRLFAYEAAKRPCDRPDAAARQANMPQETASSDQTNPSQKPSSSSPKTPTPASQPATVAASPASFTMSYGAGMIAQPAPLLIAPASAPAPAVCDERVLQARFAALAEIPVPAALLANDLGPIGRLGRRHQLGEQLAAVDALVEARQLRARRRAAGDDDLAAAEAFTGAPRFARVVHATIVGIDRLQKTIDTLELAVLALIRETLRVEHEALGDAIELAERRVRLGRAKLTAELDEVVLLLEAHASLARLERAGCTQRGLVAVHEAGPCRDESTKLLLAFGNAWTLGRAAQKRADVLDLGARHDASIVRSRAAMAVRQVYLAAGVTELVKFTRGGMPPEALAQLIVSTVGFGVLAGAVIAR